MLHARHSLAALSLAAALAFLLCARGACGAQEQTSLIEGELGHFPIHLESHGTVFVHETDEVKVFIARGDAELRQGPVRIAAPGMVVWLDKVESAKPEVAAAVVRVYAEGKGKPGEEPQKPVRLVEGKKVRNCAQLYLHMRSHLGLAWTCKLVPIDDPNKLLVYARAELITSNLRVNQVWEKLSDVDAVQWQAQIIQTLRAEEFFLFMNEEEERVTAVYLGDVRGGYKNVEVRSDVAVIWINQKTKDFEVYARGNVILSRKHGGLPLPEPGEEEGAESAAAPLAFETMRADAIYINPDQARGMARRAEARINVVPDEEEQEDLLVQPQEEGVDSATAPSLYMAQETVEDIVVVQGREIYLLDSKNMYLREGSVTNCPFGHPHYKIAGERVRLVKEDPHLFVTAWEADLKTGREEKSLVGVSSFSADVGRREAFFLRSFTMGTDSRYGVFVKTSWRLTHLNLNADWIENWILNLDYYGSRGPGIGTELDYVFDTESGARHFGNLKAYMLSDSGTEDDNGMPVTEQTRGRFWERHRVQWDPNWRTDFEFYWLSDAGFLDEYFETEFEQEKAPESYLFTRYRKDNFWAGLTIKTQVNSFMNQIAEQPSVELQWLGVPFWRFVYDASVVTGLYQLELSDLLGVADPPSLWRFHTQHKLSLPFNIGCVRFDPFVRVLGTYAGAGMPTVAGGNWEDSASGLGFGGGLRASTTFSKSFNVVNDFLDINRLRHIVTPYSELDLLSYSGDSRDFIQLGGLDPWPFRGVGPRARDDMIDAIDNHMIWKFGLRQRLQTKRMRRGQMRTVDWLDVDIAYVGRSDDSVRLMDDDGYFELDLDWRLTESFSIHSQDNRIGSGNTPDYWNLGMTLELPHHTFFSLDYYSLQDLNSAMVATLYRKLSDHYALLVQETYDFDTAQDESANLDTLVMIRRFFHKWVLDFGIEHEAYGEKGFAVVIKFAPLTPGFSTQYRKQETL